MFEKNKTNILLILNLLQNKKQHFKVRYSNPIIVKFNLKYLFMGLLE